MISADPALTKEYTILTIATIQALRYYVHITQPEMQMYLYKLQRFVRHQRTSSGIWSRDVADEHMTKTT